MRAEKRREEERKLRQSRMGAERRVQMMAREQNRDISEKVALGLAKPTQSSEGMFDSRLFNRTSGFDSGFNEDQAYDKPLFAAQDAITSIYRPRQNMEDDDDEGAADAEMGRIQKSNRFGEALGKGTFKGSADVEVSSNLKYELGVNANYLVQAREGPVQFEKDTGDVFNVDDFLSKVGESSGKRQYGLQEDEDRAAKRARVEEDED
jgi:SNW domain-containing protein 1